MGVVMWTEQLQEERNGVGGGGGSEGKRWKV